MVPLSSTIISSLSATVSMRCDITSIDMPRSSMLWKISFSVSGATYPVASSRIINAGFVASALAMSIICASPPLKFAPSISTIAEYPAFLARMKSLAHAALAARVASASEMSFDQRRMLSLTVPSKSEGSCPTYAIIPEAPGIFWITLPSTRTFPPHGVSSPAASFAMVDLPEPEIPTIAVFLPCPSFAVKSTSTGSLFKP